MMKYMYLHYVKINPNWSGFAMKLISLKIHCEICNLWAAVRLRTEKSVSTYLKMFLYTSIFFNIKPTSTRMFLPTCQTDHASYRVYSLFT